MIDHLSLPVRNVARAKKFYTAVLKPLGFRMVLAYPTAVGFGPRGRAIFWVVKGKPARLHIAFEAKDRAAVAAFHRAALKAGAKDNGPPGLRPQYHTNYYGAFVFDPEGNNSEAVCHKTAGRGSR